MSSPTNTNIVRLDEKGKQIEAAKSIYKHYGYDNASNVSVLLAFYNDGKYFANLPREQQDLIGRHCFYGAGFYRLDESHCFCCDRQGTADVLLIQNGTNKYACVVADLNHLIYLHERPHFDWKGESLDNYKIDIQEFTDNMRIDGKIYEKFSYSYQSVIEENVFHNVDKILISLEDYFELSVANYPQYREIVPIIEDFVKNENIQMMSAKQCGIWRKTNFLEENINKEENLEKTLLLDNTFNLRYSPFAENENTEYYAAKYSKANYKNSGQFLNKNKLKEYPYDKELASLLNLDLPQNESQIRNNRRKQ